MVFLCRLTVTFSAVTMTRARYVSVAQGIERSPPERKAARSIRAGYEGCSPVNLTFAGLFVLSDFINYSLVLRSIFDVV